MGQITFSAKARFLLVIGALKYAPLAAYEPLQIRRAFLFVRFEAAIQERLTYLRNAPAFVECHLLKIRLKPFCDPERKRSFLRHAIHCIDNELCIKETVTLSLYVLYCVYEDEKVNGSQPCTEGQNLRGTDNSLVNCGTTSRLSRSKLSAN